MSGYGYGQQPAGGAGYQYPYNIPVPVSNYLSQQAPPAHYQQPPPQQYGQPDYWAQQQQHHPQHLLPPPPPAQQVGYGEGELNPPPEVSVDPNAFRRFFTHHLQTLTFNSKPAITNLTMFSHQHLHRMSHIVASSLEDHLKNCPPSNRLPALYLLDSISKNIGPPYISLFCRFIERAFLSAYHAVDAHTKIKMEELLGTWRTGGPDGGELFRDPDEGRVGRVQRGIESALFGTGPQTGAGDDGLGQAQSPPPNNLPDDRSDVLVDVRRLLQIREAQAITSPDDPVNSGQISALRNLETLILTTTLTPDQLNAIRTQLRLLAPKDEPAPTPDGGHSPFPAAVAAVLSPQQPQHYASLAPPPPPTAPHVIEPPAAPVGVPGIDQGLIAQLAGLAGGDLSSLLASTEAASRARGASPAPEAPSKTEDKADIGPDPVVAEYDQALVALDVNLTNPDMLKWRPEGWSFLYARLGTQCKQCGLRFFATRQGKKNMDIHLDWHFTHKRRVREGAGRVQSRSWFIKEDDWINADTVDLSYDQAEGAAAGPSKPSAAVDRAELLKKKVVVPTDRAMADRPCPICKEKFKSEWNDADEEWVYYNAVLVDGAIAHATCSEGSASRLASRLKLEDGTKISRESTPLPGTIPASPGGSGVKRKADANANGSGEEKRPRP